MADLWYCAKCKTLFSGSQERRCGCGGRIHKTSLDMEKAYQRAGYHYDESSLGFDFTAQLGSLADRILEEEKAKEKKSLFSDFDADMKKISADLLGQLNTKKPVSKKKKASKKKTSNKNTSKSNKNTSNAPGPENQVQEENFTLISGIEPPNIKTVPSGESAQKSKKRKKTAAARKTKETNNQSPESIQTHTEPSQKSPKSVRIHTEPSQKSPESVRIHTEPSQKFPESVRTPSEPYPKSPEQAGKSPEPGRRMQESHSEMAQTGRRIPQPPHRAAEPEKAQKEEHKETIDARTQLSIMGLRKKRG